MLFGYARVSTEDQAKEGTTSLAEQQRAIQGYAMMKGVAAFDLQVFEDPGISAAMAFRNRPAGYEIWTAVKEGDCIVASKLDRIFRDSLDALQSYKDLKARNIDLVLLDMGVEPITKDNAIGKLMFTTLVAFAEWERTRIATRMMEGKEAKKRNGGHAGGRAPFGFRIVGERRESRLEMIEEEQQAIARVVQLSKNRKWWHIAKELNEEGLPYRNGKPWVDINVQRILQKYARDAASTQ